MHTRFDALIAAVAALALAAIAVPAVALAAPAVTNAPGAVLSTAEMPAAVAVPGAGPSYRLTYRTVDHFGGPAESSGSVYLPPGPAPAGGWPVISYAHGTIGVADACAPSVVGLYQPEAQYVSKWLTRGYAVVATDYIGLGTPGPLPYLDGLAAAHAVIDMVRAARTAVPDLAPRWVVAGLSQGGQATMFTAHEATRYAPELDYRGAVALGVPANLEQIFPLAGPGIPDIGVKGLTLFLLYTVMGLGHVRPDLGMDGYLSPLGRSLAAKAEQVCTVDLRPIMGNPAVGELFSKSLNNRTMRQAFTDYLAIPTKGYDRPVFLGQGVSDLVVPFPLNVKLAADLKWSGTDLRFRMYPGADHVGTLTASFDDSTRFVDAVLR
ncbi:lipase family protein [Rhodococcus kronopolitis]|uniref:lipase family protein n=1 Tax=Rhodococcus kronopolitis TaxID=1460226 RepID=UPI003A9764C9